MKRLLPSLLALITIISVFQTQTPKANAAINCSLPLFEDGGDDHWMPPSTKSTRVWFTINYPPSTANMPKVLNAYISYEGQEPQRVNDTASVEGNPAAFDLRGKEGRDPVGTLFIRDIRSSGDGAGTYSVNADGNRKWREGKYTLYIVPQGKGVSEQVCSVPFEIQPYCVIDINGTGSDYKPGWIPSFKVTDFNPYQAGGVNKDSDQFIFLTKNNVRVDRLTNKAGFMLENGISFTDTPVTEGTYQIIVEDTGDREARCKSNTFTVKPGGGYEGCRADNECTDPNAVCLPDDNKDDIRLCGISQDYRPGKIPLACKEKKNDKGLGTGEFTCQTAIGEINTDPNNFAKSILALVLSLAGMILLALLILNGYKLMTSQGDPEKIKDAREGIIAAIAGVLLIIFSLSILRFITADIIGIPGFS